MVITILEQMIGAFTSKNKCLPYGMILSSIIDSKVDNLGNVHRISIHLSKYLNHKSFTHMGYREDDSRKWVKSKKRKEIHDSEDEDDLPPSLTSSAPFASVPPPSLFPTSPSHPIGESSHPPNKVLVYGLVKLKANFTRP